ncbi:carbohydrate binding domain-containing protein [Photobacterium sp. OFAV2-7]|uniref:carbohydrate binding domain-containing protein n=1 Tax=Photobacterium sp. OFAV2-7 TaxID=2917748 RepID=UPI001EF44F49|nr:carbohydrate binding domain-containing protein [Photobacterium sp. OFAV2-7]MCG7585554.1 carbohydrate binding domain-containing protein [Photobacterium sp. OFAV2-7]
MSIKSKRKLLGLLIPLIALYGCNGSGGGSGDGNIDPGIEQPTPKPKPGEKPNPETDFISAEWHFDHGQSDLVAAAKVAGYYAVANASSTDIEIRNISQSVLHTITADKINDILKDTDLVSNTLCGMTFTPSGRFLYLALCNKGSGEDGIVAFNLNTQKLSLYERLSLNSGTDTALPHYGMTYFRSSLYVGSDQGIYRIEAAKNSVFSGGPQSPTELIASPLPVKDIALDMIGENLYALTEEVVYRLPYNGQTMTKVYQEANLSRIGFSRVFGRDSLSGLYLTKDSGDGSEILYVPEQEARSSDSLSPQPLFSSDSQLLDLATTPDGKLFYSNGDPYTLLDKHDDKMPYKEWLQDELNQYVSAIKSVVASGTFKTTNSYSPDGFLHRKIQALGTSANTTPIADTVGWAIYLLLAADKVNNDNQIETLIEQLIERHAGLMSDNLGGLKTYDGHFVRNYVTSGQPNMAENPGPQPQLYTSMKFLPAVIKAAEQYPDNDKIAQAKKYLQQIFVRSSDTIRARQGVTWQNDDFGPLKNDNGMANETWIYGDLGAAQDPLASYNYDKYVYDRDNFDYDDWVKGEPVIKRSHSAFIVMGGTLILEHHFDDAGWKQQNNNYYAITQAETDDLGSPYFAAFSAGNSPNQTGKYYNDGPSDHPDDILHFPALLGFGQHGKQGAMVGGYFAYRDGLRQKMTNGSPEGAEISMLTRWSMSIDYDMNSIGIADFWFGAIGLAETIRPGTTKELRNTFYRPKTTSIKDTEGNQVALFSALTPRHVYGVRKDKTKQSFGFQRSPFTVPGTEQFERFEAVDPEGDWIELDDLVSTLEGRERIFSNPDFESSLDGWQYYGNSSAEITTSINGQGAKVYSSTAGESILTQAVKQPIALDGSEYKVSAYIRPEQVTTAKAYIRVYWSEEGNRNLPLGSTTISQKVTSGEPGQLVSVSTIKPAGASQLHIEYVVDGVGGVDGQSFMFDNTSLQLFGALESINNGNFESSDGTGNWTFSHKQVSITNDPAKVPEGSQALQFELKGHSSWRKAETKVDVSGDADGTRYIYKMTLGEHAIADDTEFDIDVDVFPKSEDESTAKATRPAVAAVENDSPDELAFVMRKRPGDKEFHITLKMRQSKDNSESDRVVIDNLRVYKQRIFNADLCDRVNSPTGCRSSN